ncbi:MAG: glycosyltransferase family 9 protein [Desulfuromonadales bacterium]|nr:glycosyltransferase family 9 protein [Desulfuromonadales bacterium]
MAFEKTSRVIKKYNGIGAWFVVKQIIETKPVRRYSRVQQSLKAIEQGFKHSLLAVLTRVSMPRTESAPEWNSRTLRVLFLRHDRIGDMIVSTAVIRAIAQSHANIKLDVLASPLNAAVIEKDPLVHQVVRFDVRRFGDYWRLLRHLRATHYDIVVDSMVFGQSLTTMLLMIATRAPHRTGVRKPGKPNVYTMFAEPAGANAHHVEHLAQLAMLFGVTTQNAHRLEIVLTDAERAAALMQWDAGNQKRVLINISVGKAFRQWPNENFVAVAQHLKARLPDARVIILHGPAERQRAQMIADAAGVMRADTPGVREALALVATAHFVFTPDTSIVHAASAFRIPTVAMFTGDKAQRWGLFGTVGEIVVCPGETLATIPMSKTLEAIDNIVFALES